MSKPRTKGRVAGNATFSAARPVAGFGSTFSTSNRTNLSYLSEIPDFSSISDANVVVAMRNILKKDSTTKAKGLEDLLSHVHEHPYEQGGGVEEAVLDAWTQLYTRSSIDNSRRVRELSHTLQYDLMKSARKRMERRITKVIGTWLAGTFDKDRIVARAASDGLSSFLNTEEKTTQLWRKCQSQILEYATDAVKETPDTLSDERSTSKDDADAKYYRVLGASVLLVLGLLRKLKEEDIAKEQDAYNAYFAEDAVWAAIAVPDPHVRRSALQLVSLLLDKQETLVTTHLPRLGKVLISDGLRSNQGGSAIDFVKLLTTVTQRYPQVWGEKKQPFMRLRPLLEKGSQGSSSAAAGDSFWRALDQLVATIPQQTITLDAAVEVIKALRSGICGREEPRVNAVDAWTVYLTTIRALADIVEGDGSQVKLFREHVYPLIDHYMHPSPERSAWTAGTHLAVLSRAFLLISRSSHSGVLQSFEAEWARLAEHLISKMSNSLPEVSKDYQKSQSELAEEGSRWFALVETIHQDLARIPSSTEAASALVDVPSAKILDEALQLLVKRNYKPYGAAAILSSAYTHTPHLAEAISLSLIPRNDPEQIQLMLASQSATYFLTCLDALSRVQKEIHQYKTHWQMVIGALLEHESADGRANLITQLLSNVQATDLAHDHQALQQYLQEELLLCAMGRSDSWDLFEIVFTFNSLTPSVSQTVVGDIERVLGQDGSVTDALVKALQIIASKSPDLVSGNAEIHLGLVKKLLGAMEIADGATRADLATLRALIEQSPSKEGESPMVKIIQDNLDQVTSASLEIGTLVEQAQSVAQHGAVTSDNLLPSTNVWMSELLGLLGELNPSLALTSNLGGLYFLTQSNRPSTAAIKRDRRGLSIPVRMARYTVQLLATVVKLAALPRSLQVELVYLLYLVAEVGSDQIALASDNGLWASLAQPDALTEAEDLISAIRNSLNGVISNALKTNEGEAFVDDLIEAMLSQCAQLTPIALYSSRSLSLVFQSLAEARGFPSSEEGRVMKFDLLKATPSTVMGASAIFAGYGEMLASSKTINTLCNRLVSDVAGADSSSPKSLINLVLLNACMAVYETGELPVANNRLVFAVRQITGWFDEQEKLDGRLATEACRALQRLLPCIKEVYGSYWEKTVDFCLHLWERAQSDSQSSRLPYIHASLKLSSALDSIQEPNDDLVEALHTFAEHRSEGLVDLLGLTSDRATQPQEIVDTILCRQVEKIPLEHIKDLSDVYGLLAADSRDIQTAAYHLLSRALPAAQQQISLDVLLDKKDAQLPDELLSLLLDAPTIDAYPDESLANFPAPIRSYLLTWHVIFSTYKSASPKVRNDYSNNLKSADYVAPLLDFTFDVLGHSAAHPLNLDKGGFGQDAITSYDVKLADTETEERNMHWLLINVYYLTLKYLPGLFKTWYLDCRSKQTRIAVESWTAKYFSPIIVSETLDEVAQWAATQEEPTDDEQELLVKVSRLSREVVAGYEVDEMQASIAIRIPQNYPIEGVSVVGNNRVAVNEKKWQSWLMSTQGVITFSNGSIIDGLIAFRRNVVGALKGQTECAICYSIISSDKRMPDKRCGTCKNLFHRSCLYKWFLTSNQNTCPLCRNPIDYLGADKRRT